MLRFLVRRLLFGVLVLWLISVAVFVLFFVAPHDPARTIAGRQSTAETSRSSGTGSASTNPS